MRGLSVTLFRIKRQLHWGYSLGDIIAIIEAPVAQLDRASAF